MSLNQQNANTPENKTPVVLDAAPDNVDEVGEEVATSAMSFPEIMQGQSLGVNIPGELPSGFDWMKGFSLTGSAGQDLNGDGKPDFKLAGLDNNLDGLNDFRHLDFNNPSREQLQNLANKFNTTPETVGRLIAEALKNGCTVSPEKQREYLKQADSEIGSAVGQISVGSADAGDLSKLLSVYSNLNGFPDGAAKQGAVGAMMDRVRSVLAAVAAGKALGNFDYASIIHNRRTVSSVQHQAEVEKKQQV